MQKAKEKPRKAPNGVHVHRRFRLEICDSYTWSFFKNYGKYYQKKLKILMHISTFNTHKLTDTNKSQLGLGFLKDPCDIS